MRIGKPLRTLAKAMIFAGLSASALGLAMPAGAAQFVFTGTRENSTPPPVPGTGRCAPAYVRTIIIEPGAISSTGASNFGAFTASLNHCEDTAAFPRAVIDGFLTFNFDAGDSLLGTYSGLITLSGTPGIASVLHNMVITGGTGRFLGASGAITSTGTLRGVSTPNGPIGVFEGTLQGRLDLPAVPEPASWAMLVAGLGLVGQALRRRGVTYRTVALT